MTEAVIPGTSALELAEAAGTTVNLSLVSHTNAGKTTLTRTMLGRDVGEVRDAAHVTEIATGYVLVQEGGDTLMLWDTPGFGDTTRLLTRLRNAGNPIGWLLTQVWDRWKERPLWSSQQAVKNARDNADVLLYLVNASEDPAAAGYVAQEMEVLSWIGKPVLLLLNQMGPPRADTGGEREKWLAHLDVVDVVKGALPLDAFARCWVQEGALLREVEPLLPADKQPAMGRLSARWHDLNRARFDQSMAVLARQLTATLQDRESVRDGTWRDRTLNAFKSGKGEDREVRAAMGALSERLAERTRESTSELIRLHGLEGEATRKVLERLGRDYSYSEPTPEGFSAMLGGLASGAVGGLAADLAAGGLTLGGGMIVGAVLGALGAGGLAKGINMAKGEDGSAVRWSPEFFQGFVGAALLRYLAVAHFGRGRGAWEEGEHPDFWHGVVEEAVAAHEGEVAALYKAGRGEGGAEVESELAALLERIGLDVLGRLYPGAGM
ncbi:DUF3482 domain-containing protein [Paraurantiacibacter namhicola]|uniref:GTPase HflX n=1 Tax=Paraurantiacibacter namhicola TaxID=645517 RepID=A0A1C7D7Y9_9SPHN|nr:DUF3482 domain-containing protein [Paraurantiacibacter namhicola]ANU07599.1 GTPase HflX [Paraurantiacibacter namhicola]